MNGKMAKMLRRIGKADKKSKRAFKSMPHPLRRQLRANASSVKFAELLALCDG